MPWREIGRILVPFGAIGMGMKVGQLCTQKDFDLLDSRKEDAAQFTVELIDLIDAFKCNAVIAAVFFLEGQKICGQPVLADCGQNRPAALTVLEPDAALMQDLKLFLICSWRF